MDNDIANQKKYFPDVFRRSKFTKGPIPWVMHHKAGSTPFSCNSPVVQKLLVGLFIIYLFIHDGMQPGSNTPSSSTTVNQSSFL